MARSYSNSELQSYKNCPLQWRFQWDLGLRKREDEASEHHLRFGNAIHKGLEQLYLGRNWEAVKDAFLKAYPVQLDANDKAKTAENGITALAAYAKQYREQDRKQWRVIATETRSDDPWSVKPDLIVENTEHGGLWLVDHKTTGRYLNYDYWEQFQPNSQITHYLDYATQTYGVIEGFIINAISFRFRERAYKGEPAGFWHKFERQVFNRNASQFQFERLSRADWIADLERSQSNGFWRTNTGACRFCSFKTLCAPGWTWEDDRELIEIQYRQICDALLTDDEHCYLDRDHDGEHSPFQPESLPLELVIEV